jgi:hypothetical protein
VTGSWVGLDRGDASHEHLEHDLFEVLHGLDVGEVRFVGTFMVRGHEPHWAASLEFADLDPVAAVAVAQVLIAGLDRSDCASEHRSSFSDPHSGVELRQAAAGAVLGEPGGPDTLLGAEANRITAHAAAAALRGRVDTRIVRFPGQDELGGELTAAQLAARTPISELVGTGIELRGKVSLRTHGHVRPTFVDGDLVLVVMACDEAANVVRPFELPVPRQCCETPEQFDARWRGYLRTHATGPSRPVPADQAGGGL